MPEVPIEELEKLPPQLRPICIRYGLELFNFALIVAGTNHAVDQVLNFGNRFDALKPPSMVILNNMTKLCEEILTLREWNMDQVTECIQDIGRAQELAPATPRIILH